MRQALYGAAIKIDPRLNVPARVEPRHPSGCCRGATADALEIVCREPPRLQTRPMPHARNNLGRLLVAQGKPDEGMDHLRAAIGAQPAHAAAHFNLATALLQGKNDARGAIDHFREAIRLRPDWPPAPMALAWVLSSHPDAAIRKPEEALDLARQAVALTNRDPSALDALAAAYTAARPYDEAVSAASEAAAAARIAGAKQQLTDIERRLALYRSGKPYVEQLR